jgi:hypothetical protein
VEHRAGEFPIAVGRAGLAVADRVGVLGAQPRLDAGGVPVGLRLFAESEQVQNLLLPPLIGQAAAFGVVDGGIEAEVPSPIIVLFDRGGANQNGVYFVLADACCRRPDVLSLGVVR